MSSKLYIWQRDDWPSFKWNEEKIFPLLFETGKNIAFLNGRMSSFSPDVLKESYASSLEEEVLNSNSIEGIYFNRASVRSSILKRLHEGYSEHVIDSDEDGSVDVLFDAITNFNKPLTKERLLSWHSALFPSGFSSGRRIITGAWRKGEMYVVSGSAGREVIHFEAPPSERLDDEVDKLLSFINDDDKTNDILKAAIAHLWFVTIHPFPDGNGRIARTITEMLLARSDGSKEHYYSLSSEIVHHKNDYYEVLEYTQKGNLDITRYLEYFLKTINGAVATSNKKIEKSLEKTKFWDSIRSISLNDRQIKIINKLIEGFEGKLTTEKYSKINKCSHSTALRDIRDLLDKGIMKDDGSLGKNIVYDLKFPE